MNIKPAQLVLFCKNPNPAIRCIVLFGSNEGLINELQNKCVETVCGGMQDAFNYALLEMGQISKDGGELYAEYNAQSLMGGRRVVVLKDADNAVASTIKALLAETKSDNLLIITSENYNTKSALITWAKDRSDVYTVGCYDDRQADISQSVQEMLAEKNLVAGFDVLQVLVARLSADRKMNQSEIDKLATYMDTRKVVEIEDIKKVISDIGAANYDDLCYNTADGNLAKACEVFDFLVAEGENAATLVRQIAYHFAKLLSVCAETQNGKSVEEALKILRPPLVFYRKDSFVKQLKYWKKERILSALSMLYDCERECKTTGMPAEVVAQYCILRLGAAANKFKKM